MMPNIRFYARMLNTTQKGKKTPKYTIIGAAGFYPPMELLRGRDTKISMNLMEKLKEGENVPSMRLQAKGSLNFTGLKEWFVNDKLSGFAYGYPSNKPPIAKTTSPTPSMTTGMTVICLWYTKTRATPKTLYLQK